MSGKIIGIGIACIVGVILVWLVCAVVGVSNQEVTLRTMIETKQKDNKSEFDNMWKKIAGVAEVTQAQKDALKEILIGYANARSTGDGKDLIMKWVQESVPNIDTTTFNNLQNIIVSSRDAWTFRQKELLDLSREHTILLRRFPEGFILTSFMGRKLIDVTIVTSTKTEKVFEAGKDDDVGVFKTKPVEVERNK